MRLSKRLGLAASTLAASTALLVGPAITADAAPAAPAPTVRLAPEHGANQNGCGPSWATWIPDSGYYNGVYWNFHSACDWHDVCYHNKRGRSYCDKGFHSRMRSWCVNRYDRWYERPARYVCYTKAAQYYGAVVVGGWGSY